MLIWLFILAAILLPHFQLKPRWNFWIAAALLVAATLLYFLVDINIRERA